MQGFVSWVSKSGQGNQEFEAAQNVEDKNNRKEESPADDKFLQNMMDYIKSRGFKIDETYPFEGRMHSLEADKLFWKPKRGQNEEGTHVNHL